MTQGLTVILKPGYAPVEQYADDASLRQGPWTDIYALAAVMHFAINKTPPPTSVARVVKDSLIPLQQGQHPGFSEKFLQAIDKGLAIQPEDRPQSMDEFRRLLGIPAFISARNPRSSRSSGANPNETQSGTVRNGKSSSRHNGKSKKNEDEPEENRRGASKPGLIMFALGLALLLGGAVYLSKRQNDAPSTTASAPSAQTTPTPVPTPVQTTPPPVATVTPSATVTPQATPQPASAEASAASASAASSTSATASSPAAASAAGTASTKPDLEADDWAALQKAELNADKLNAFLQKYPDGKYAEQAKGKLADLSKEEAAKEEPKYPVRLAIKPWGEVIIDGKSRGVSPPKKAVALTEGKHKVRIKNGAFPDYVAEIDVSKKKNVVIEHEFKQ